jgi:hypothetical protein
MNKDKIGMLEFPRAEVRSKESEAVVGVRSGAARLFPWGDIGMTSEWSEHQ